jgi:tagatose-1,6-bisphosphate aldolase non-catalytic subunit AgaZ/GatZ
MIEAGAASLRGQTARAAAGFAAASAWYTRFDMAMFAACADYGRASLDPAAAAERAAALSQLRAEGVVDPVRWITWYVVGLRSVVTVPA